MIAEDLASCYPGEYLTHAEPPEASPDWPPMSAATGARQRLRRAIEASTRGQRTPGAFGLLGRLLATRRPFRERAYFGLFDELIPWRTAPMRALDAGCGAGGLLVRLTRAGWAAEGVEIDPAAVEVARRVSGRPVTVGEFRSADLPTGAYDLVVLRHVFEHLEDPIAALRRIRELLAPGGRAVLIYPNPESLGARVFGEAWFHWDPPRHLVVPPAGALAAAARSVGLDVLRVRTAGPLTHLGFKHSRAVRAGRTGADLRDPPQSEWDVVAGRAERALIAAGLAVGDEVILTLRANG